MLYNYCLNSYTLLRIYESRECVQMLTAHSISHHHQTISTKDILSLMLGHLFRERERKKVPPKESNSIESIKIIAMNQQIFELNKHFRMNVSRFRLLHSISLFFTFSSTNFISTFAIDGLPCYTFEAVAYDQSTGKIYFRLYLYYIPRGGPNCLHLVWLLPLHFL